MGKFLAGIFMIFLAGVLSFHGFMSIDVISILLFISMATFAAGADEIVNNKSDKKNPDKKADNKE